ncbi:MAG: signal peptidase II [Alphaproteobacteria bacterium]|nr:signal peptidase II [Alphaproteobacteria bacterium]
MSKFRIGLLVAAVALLLDQVVKVAFLYGAGWIDTLGQPGSGHRVEVLPFFDLVMVWNRGISYGLLQAESDFHRWVLVAFAVGVTGFLIWWLRGIQDLRLAQAVGLIIGGAVGNVIDRILYGAVADFFLLHAFGYEWYVFNVADTAVVLGVVIMGLDLLINEWRARMRAKEDRT